eukprot:Pgem_evm2s14615
MVYFTNINKFSRTKPVVVFFNKIADKINSNVVDSIKSGKADNKGVLNGFSNVTILKLKLNHGNKSTG